MGIIIARCTLGNKRMHRKIVVRLCKNYESIYTHTHFSLLCNRQEAWQTAKTERRHNSSFGCVIFRHVFAYYRKANSERKYGDPIPPN